MGLNLKYRNKAIRGLVMVIGSFSLLMRVSFADMPTITTYDISVANSHQELSVLLGKIHLNCTNMPSVEMMTDNRKPTRKERVALRTLVEIFNDEKAQMDHPGNDRWVRDMNNRMYDRFILSAIRLYQGELTYGQYSRAAYDIVTEYRRTSRMNVENMEREDQEQKDRFLMYMMYEDLRRR